MQLLKGNRSKSNISTGFRVVSWFLILMFFCLQFFLTDGFTGQSSPGVPNVGGYKWYNEGDV